MSGASWSLLVLGVVVLIVIFVTQFCGWSIGSDGDPNYDPWDDFDGGPMP